MMWGVGTFGSGPFGSDGACDLLDSLAEYPPDRRAAVLTDLFDRLAADPETLGREIFADEIMAAVAVVAVSLAHVHADEPWWRDVTEQAQRAAPATVSPHVASIAIAALAAIREPWSHGWTDPVEAATARETVNRLSDALHTNC
jgi:alpha-glucosidase